MMCENKHCSWGTEVNEIVLLLNYTLVEGLSYAPAQIHLNKKHPIQVLDNLVLQISDTSDTSDDKLVMVSRAWQLRKHRRKRVEPE